MAGPVQQQHTAGYHHINGSNNTQQYVNNSRPSQMLSAAPANSLGKQQSSTKATQNQRRKPGTGGRDMHGQRSKGVRSSCPSEIVVNLPSTSEFSGGHNQGGVDVGQRQQVTSLQRQSERHGLTNGHRKQHNALEMQDIVTTNKQKHDDNIRGGDLRDYLNMKRQSAGQHNNNLRHTLDMLSHMNLDNTAYAYEKNDTTLSTHNSSSYVNSLTNYQGTTFGKSSFSKQNLNDIGTNSKDNENCDYGYSIDCLMS